MRNLTTKAFWILFSDGGAKLFGFFTTIYLARTFGAESYGLIVLALSVLGICIWFSDLGIQTLATRTIAASEPENRTPARFFWLKVLLSITVVLVSALLIWFILSDEPVLRSLVLLFLISLLPQSLQIRWYYNGTQEFKWITLSNWIQGSVYLGGLLLIVSSDDLFSVPIIYSISILAGAVTMLIVYRGNQSLLNLPDISGWADDIKNSVYLGAGHFMAQSIILLPPIVIGYFFSESDVGYYSVAFKLILIVMLADKMINTLLLANLSKLRNERPDDVQPQLEITARWMVVIGSLGTLVLYFTSDTVIPLLFGSDYESSILMLQILSFILPVTFLNSVYSYGLISFGEDLHYMKSTLLGGFGAIILMIAAGFTSTLELMLTAVVLSEVLITLSIYSRFKKTMRLPIQRFIFFSACLLIISIAAGSLLPVHNLFALIISAVIFAGVLVGTGLLRPGDLSWMKRRVTQ